MADGIVINKKRHDIIKKKGVALLTLSTDVPIGLAVRIRSVVDLLYSGMASYNKVSTSPLLYHSGKA